MLDYLSQIKRKRTRKVENEIVKNIFYLLAHKGSGFDSYVVLKNLPHWRTVVSLIKNGAGIVYCIS